MLVVMNEANKLLNEYLDYLEIEKNRSIKTRENYSRYINYFFKTAGIEKLSDITEKSIREFRLKLARTTGRQGENLKHHRIHQRTSCL